MSPTTGLLIVVLVIAVYCLYMWSQAATVGRGPLVPILVPIQPVLNPLMLHTHRLWHRRAPPAAPYGMHYDVRPAVRAHGMHYGMRAHDMHGRPRVPPR